MKEYPKIHTVFRRDPATKPSTRKGKKRPSYSEQTWGFIEAVALGGAAKTIPDLHRLCTESGNFPDGVPSVDAMKKRFAARHVRVGDTPQPLQERQQMVTAEAFAKVGLSTEDVLKAVQEGVQYNKRVVDKLLETIEASKKEGTNPLTEEFVEHVQRVATAMGVREKYISQWAKMVGAYAQQDARLPPGALPLGHGTVVILPDNGRDG